MRLLRLCLLILALRLFLSDPIIVYDSFVVSLKGELSRKRNISVCNRIPRTACWGSLNLTGQYVTPKLQKSQAESVFRTKKFTKVTYLHRPHRASSEMTRAAIASVTTACQNADSMPSSPHQRRSLYQLPYLFGADMALAALCWMLLFAEQMQITVIDSRSVSIPCMQIWGLTLFLRFVRGLRAGDAFYRRLFPLHLLLIFGLLISSDLMLLYRIGQDFLFFSILPVVLLLLSGAAHLFRCRNLGSLFLSTALAAACLAPAFQLNGFIHPLQMLRFSPLALLGLLFFLFLRETETTSPPRSADSQNKVRLYGMLTIAGLGLLNLHNGVPPTEQFLHYALLIGIACLFTFSRVLRYISPENTPATTAPAMAIPAIAAWFILL